MYATPHVQGVRLNHTIFVREERLAIIRTLEVHDLPTPFADGFIGDDHPADEQEFFHITVAERETEIQPDRVADDFTGKAMMFVGIRRG